jgi:hypothetical protein
MAQFPRTESEVLALAQSLSTGLTNFSTVYPAPPVVPLEMTTLIANVNTARSTALAAQTAAEEMVQAKVEALEELVAAMKKNLRYAENTVDYEDSKLNLLGWSGPKAPTPLEAPGQCLSFHTIKQGEGWVRFAWSAPVSGGKVSAYKVMRRLRPEGAWEDVATAVEPKVDLVDQPRGSEFEYRVVAVNKSGEGDPSNTEMVVL